MTFKNRVNFAAAVGTIVLIMLTLAPWVSSFILDSSQLDGQSNDNDHVLLFKFPNSISMQEQGQQFSHQAQIQFQLHPRQQQQQQLQLQPQLQAQTRSQLQAQLQSKLQAQLQAQLQQQQAPTALLNEQDLMTSANQSIGTQQQSLLLPIGSVDQYFQKHQRPDLELDEQQSISVTLPLSLARGSQQQNSIRAGLVFRPSTQVSSASKFMTSGSSQHLDSSLLDYLVDSMPLPQYGQQYSVDSRASPQQQQSLAAATSFSQPQNMAQQPAAQQHRTSIERQQVEHFTTTATTTTTAMPIITATIEPALVNPQEELWQSGTQTGQIWVQQESYVQRNHSQQALESEQSLGSSSFLSRLTNSSPELLLRLRNLLRQVNPQQSSTNLTCEDHLSKNSSKSLQESNRDGHPTIEIKQPVNEPGRQLLNSQTQNILNTFLTKHNLSSHDEIKIPLVVIAMPRILSLRRNRLSSSQPKVSNQTSSSSVYPIIKTPPKTATSANYTQKSNVTTPIHFSPNSPDNLTSSNTSIPYSPLHSSQVYHYHHHHHHQPQHNAQVTSQQQVATTTASTFPQHTMAPYARQFSSLPVNSPLLRQLANGQAGAFQYQANPKLLHQVNQSAEYIEPSLIESTSTYPIGQSTRAYIQMISTGPNHNSTSSSEPSYPGNSQEKMRPHQLETNNLRIQLADFGPQLQVEQSQTTPPAQVLYSAGGLPQSAYELQVQGEKARPESYSSSSANDQTRHQANMKTANQLSEKVFYADSKPQSQIYLRVPPQLTSSDTQSSNVTYESNWDETKTHTSANLRTTASTQMLTRQTTPSAVASDAPSSKLASLAEEGLSRLRPLFQVGKLNSGRGEQNHLLEDKLSAGQLLNLLSHSTEQRSNDRQADQSIYQPLHQQLTEQEAKNAAKIVLMIV